MFGLFGHLLVFSFCLQLKQFKHYKKPKKIVLFLIFLLFDKKKLLATYF